uniref:hypothetical protein n=1 Tax=Alistipes sp. TaxID=1872444 RepID=UPI0040570564
MDSQKIYLAGNGGGSSTTDAALLGAALGNRAGSADNSSWWPMLMMMMGGGGGFGMNYIWPLFLLYFLRGGFGGWGNGFGGGCSNAAGFGFLSDQIRNTSGYEIIMQALSNNNNAITQLANQFGCSIGEIRTALQGFSTQLCQFSGQTGMSFQQVINALQSGDAALASKFDACCCDLKGAIKDVAIGQERGFSTVAYETQRQTCDIEKAIAALGTLVTGRIDNLEKNAMQDKLDALREKNSTLTTQLNLEHQTNAIQTGTAAQLAPVAGAVNDLIQRIAKLECKAPETVTLPYSPAVAVPNCLAGQFGLGCLGLGLGLNGGGIWG